MNKLINDKNLMPYCHIDLFTLRDIRLFSYAIFNVLFRYAMLLALNGYRLRLTPSARNSRALKIE